MHGGKPSLPALLLLRLRLAGEMENQFHVLAVDDSLIDRMVIERILLSSSSSSSSSYRVTVVDSGRKALEFLGLLGDDEKENASTTVNHRIHHHDGGGGGGGVEVNLIITDYSMPGMTGYELLRKIKESSSYLKDVPVVMMSSENVPSRINRCLEQGADGFFLKPVKQSDVNGLIPQLLLQTRTATNDDHHCRMSKNSEECVSSA